MSNERQENPIEQQNPNWKLVAAIRRSACDNRPGRKKMYVRVMGKLGEPLPDVRVSFDTEPSEGIVYDHGNYWGVTDENGYLEWNHLGIPTRYWLYMDEDEMPLVTNIRTDFGNEYCRKSARYHPGNWRPHNRPGRYSYDIVIQRRW